MASKSRIVGTCPICSEDFVEPKKLSCDHSLCEKCVARLRTETKIMCPKCSAFSDIKNIKPDEKVTEYLQKLEAETKSLRKEFQNKTGSLLDNWQKIVTNLSQQSRLLNVKVTSHREALSQIHKAISQARGTLQISLKSSTDMRAACIADVNNLFDSIDSRILGFIEAHVQEFERYKKNLYLQLSEIEEKQKAIGDVIKRESLNQSRDAEILMEDVRIFIDSLTSQDIQIDNPSVSITRNKEWRVAQAATLHLAGDTSIDKDVSAISDALQPQLSLSDVSKRKWVKQKEQELTSCAYTLRVIHEQLWCCHDDGITVYSSDLEPLRTLPSDDMGQVFDVTQMSNGDVVVAADNGLYHFDATGGRRLHSFVSYRFSSMCIHAGKEYVAPFKTCQIRVYEYSTTWSRCTARFKLPCDTSNLSLRHWITLTVRTNQIVACCFDCNKIYILSLDGKLLSTHGERGSSDAGTFNGPYICDVDRDGNTLIADDNNNRLQIRSAGGPCKVVDMNPAVVRPRCVVRFAGCLFVTSQYEEKLYKYTY